jgi:hypothetical protein
MFRAPRDQPVLKDLKALPDRKVLRVPLVLQVQWVQLERKVLPGHKVLLVLRGNKDQRVHKVLPVLQVQQVLKELPVLRDHKVLQAQSARSVLMERTVRIL